LADTVAAVRSASKTAGVTKADDLDAAIEDAKAPEGADPLFGITARFDLYGDTTQAAWEEGYGTSVTSGTSDDDGPVAIVWKVEDDNACALCQQHADDSPFDEDSLPGFPGDGGFGSEDPDALCEGGSRCRCSLDYVVGGEATQLFSNKAVAVAAVAKWGNEGNPEALIRWFNEGADGKIDWGNPGDFDQCVAEASKHMSEEQAKGFCNLRHQDAVGGPPGSEDQKS